MLHLTRPECQVENGFSVLRCRDPLQVIVESVAAIRRSFLLFRVRLLIMIDCVSQTCRTVLVNIREIRGRAMVVRRLRQVLRFPDQVNVDARSALEKAWAGFLVPRVNAVELINEAIFVLLVEAGALISALLNQLGRDHALLTHANRLRFVDCDQRLACLIFMRMAVN